ARPRGSHEDDRPRSRAGPRSPGRRAGRQLKVMRSTSFLRRTTAGLASLVTLIAVAVGVPLALSRLAGWPLPAALPSPHEIAHALSRNEISDSTFFKALALVGWFAWVQIASSIVVETIAWARGGGAAPRLRFAGIAQ